MQDHIAKDISRCNNHRCFKRTVCMRYMQLGLDFINYRKENDISNTTPVADKVLPTIPVTRFDVDEKTGKCEYFLEKIYD